jgi:hypothetical protein
MMSTVGPRVEMGADTAVALVLAHRLGDQAPPVVTDKSGASQARVLLHLLTSAVGTQETVSPAAGRSAH